MIPRGMSEGGMGMKTSPWVKAAIAAALIAAQPVSGQGPHEPPPPSSGSGPEKLFEGIGNAIQNLFRGIFGAGEGEIGTPPPSSEPQAAPVPKPAAAPAAVTATPAALAPPQTLHAAIAKGDDAGAVKLIESGADVESKEPGAGASPLHYAVMKDKIALVGLLVQRGADVNSRTRSGTTPLHTAVLYGRLQVAEFLLEKGADINAKSASGATPLSLADAANFQLIAKMLRQKGAK
jgi:hypothetical protein